MTKMIPNESAEAASVGAGHSAVAVHAASVRLGLPPATQYDTRWFSRKPDTVHSLSPRERAGVRGNNPADFTRTHPIAVPLFRSTFSDGHTRIRGQVFRRWLVH
jgi:hypothetical protein